LRIGIKEIDGEDVDFKATKNHHQTRKSKIQPTIN